MTVPSAAVRPAPPPWALPAAVAGVVALLATTTIGAAPGGGDAPESTAGVASLGILHAPGYALYVLAARAFSLLVPFGDLAERVQWFSVACAGGTAAIVVLLARWLGSSAAAAAVGALGLATTASFWFDATFAKHGSFTALLVAGALLLAVNAGEGQRLGRHLTLGLVMGLSLGAGWYAMAVSSPVILWVAVGRADRVRRAATVVLGAAAGAGLVVAWVLWRSAQGPQVAWGAATDLGRLIALLTLDDFGYGPTALGDVVFGGDSSGVVDPGGASRLVAVPGSLLDYLVVVVRDVGPALAAVAVIGAVARPPRVHRALIALVALNLVIVATALGVVPRGFESGLVHGTFVLPALLSLALLAARGTDAVVNGVRRVVGRRRQWQFGASVALIAVGAAVVVPSVIVHHGVADHPDVPLSGTYGRAVLDDLPVGTLLIAGTTQTSFPLLHVQVVEGHRPDVTVVRADSLDLEWYREQAAEHLGDLAIPSVGTTFERATALALAARHDRPVALDVVAWQALGSRVPLIPSGLTASVLPPGVSAPLLLPNGPAASVEEAIAESGLMSTPAGSRWPHDSILDAHLGAAVRTGLAYLERDQVGHARRLLQLAFRLDPDDATVAWAARSFATRTGGPL